MAKEIDGGDIDPMIVIPREEYEALLSASKKLEALEFAGVVSWEGYPEALTYISAEA